MFLARDANLLLVRILKANDLGGLRDQALQTLSH